jgi:hypothetical protein
MDKTRSEWNLLSREIEIQGEIFEAERLRLRSEIDHLKLQNVALRRTLTQLDPAFAHHFRNVYDDLLRHYDPEQYE